MNKIARIMIGIGAVFLAGTIAHADTVIDSLRLMAGDIDATEHFYQQAFGAREVRRIANGDHIEVFLGFGPPSAGQGAVLVLLKRRPTASESFAHLILRVTDIAGAAGAAKAAGGTVAAEPHAVPGGLMAAEMVDPAGNHVELVQFPPQ